jgi:hypothetical protein
MIDKAPDDFPIATLKNGSMIGSMRSIAPSQRKNLIRGKS